MSEPTTFEEACRMVIDDICQTVISKQADYGQRNITDFGEIGIIIRMNDKFARLKNLTTKKKPPRNETKTDTWRDIAGYAVIALMLEKGWFELPLNEE